MKWKAVLPLTAMAAAMAALVVALVLLVETKPAQAAFPGQNGRFVYESDGIYTVSPAGGSATKVLANTTEYVNGHCCKRTYNWGPTLSPNGKKIAFTRSVSYDNIANAPTVDSEIFTVPVTGGVPTQLTNNSTNDYEPSWSPNGQKIVYSGRNASTVDIYTIPATGGTPTKISRNNQPTGAFNPVFSPDGTKIAYDGDDNEGNGDWEVFTIPVGGGTPTNVTNNSTDDISPAWSPDSKTIVYEGSDPNGNDEEIFTIPAAGGTPTNITKSDDQTREHCPAFSPDGTMIAYYKSDQRFTHIYKIPRAGGTPSVVSVNNTESENDLDWGVATDYSAPMVNILDQNFIENSTILWDSTFIHPKEPFAYRVPVSLNWSATNNDGIAKYQLQQSTDGGTSYKEFPLSAPAATGTTLWLMSREYKTRQFRVRAQDTNGNWGPWVVGPSFRANNYMDDNVYHGVTYSSGDWKTATNEQYFGGVQHYAISQGGGTAQFSFKGRNVAWVATRSPGGGSAAVYVDGVHQKTVDLASATTRYRTLVFTRRWASWGPHTVTIRVLQTSASWTSLKPVSVDDFMVLE